MDFILNKFEARIATQDHGSSTHVNLLRQRVEYMIFLSLAYVWDKEGINIDFEDYSDIVTSFRRIGIGKVVEAIRRLDPDKENILINKATVTALNQYPSLRNDTHGHGYVVDNEHLDQQINALEEIYETLAVNVPIFKHNIDYIYVTKIEGNVVSGLRFPTEKNGMPVRWSCPKAAFNHPEPIVDRTFLLTDQGEYVKVSPFIYLADDGEEQYLFVSLEERLNGKVKYARLLRTGTEYKEWEEFREIHNIENDDRKISANGTIMNMFENNFSHYIEINTPIEKQVYDFLLKSKANVACTLWGHGGVGKTALIQHIATQLFYQARKSFDYIVFTSAKDRLYNTSTGKIEEILDNIRTFEEVIHMLSETIFGIKIDYDDFLENVKDYTKQIIEHENKILIIIDDFETFPDNEKEKLNTFISQLDINHHKVIITTRVKHGIIGIELQTAELSEAASKDFLIQITEFEYKSHVNELKKVVNDPIKMQNIHRMTTGRPIFLFQFIHLFVQYGFNESDYEKLLYNEEAKKFLYDRLYDYLSDDAKNIFVYLAKLVMSDDLNFNKTALEYLVTEMEGRNDIDQEMEELSKMRIIIFDSANVYRVYSDEIVKLMNTYFNNRRESFQKKVLSVIEKIGEVEMDKDIYEVLYERINQKKNIKSVEKVMNDFRNLLDDPNCSIDIKHQALQSVTGHLEALKHIDKAIEMFKEYDHLFDDNQDMIRLYVRILWIAQNPDSLVVLQKYFSTRKKSDPESLTLLFIWAEYQGRSILSRRRNEINAADGDEDIIQEIRHKYKLTLINYIEEFALPIHHVIQHADPEDISEPMTIHHLSNAASAIIRIGTEMIILDDENNNRLEVIVKLAEYGIEHLQKRVHPVIQNCMKNIMEHKGLEVSDQISNIILDDFTRFKQTVKLGDMKDFTITGIAPFGVFGDIGGVPGLMHKSKIPKNFRNNLHDHFAKDMKIQVSIIDIKEEEENFSASFHSFQTDTDKE